MNKVNKIFNYKFKDHTLLELALTHPSSKQKANYQNLEFVGDRLISAILAEELYKKYPDENEGALSKRLIGLVKGETIAQIAEQEDIAPLIIMSQGEEQTGGRVNKSNLEDVLEALIAAIYFDSGDYQLTKKIILKIWAKTLKEQQDPPEDPKSSLQEYLQARNLPLPQYRLVERSGSDHAPIFTMELRIKGYKPFRADAPAKKKCEIELARLALEQIAKPK